MVCFYANISYLPPEKNGKTLHLLKASSKKISGERKRKKVPILGSFEMYKDSKKQERQQEQQLQIPPDLLMDP